MAVHLNSYEHQHLLTVVTELQHFYSLPSSPGAPGAAVAGVYRALRSALRAYSVPDGTLKYIDGKMPDSVCRSGLDVEEQIEQGIREAEGVAEVDRFSVDLRLRCLLVVMRDGELAPYRPDRSFLRKTFDRLRGRPTRRQIREHEERLLEPVARHLTGIVLAYNRARRDRGRGPLPE